RVCGLARRRSCTRSSSVGVGGREATGVRWRRGLGGASATGGGGGGGGGGIAATSAGVGATVGEAAASANSGGSLGLSAASLPLNADSVAATSGPECAKISGNSASTAPAVVGPKSHFAIELSTSLSRLGLGAVEVRMARLVTLPPSSI